MVPPTGPPSEEKYPLNSSGFTSVDVLSGRGGLANTHTGNRVFRRLVELNKSAYQGLKTKREKGILVESIVLAIQNQGGRFLKQNPRTGLWDEEMPYKGALLKTGQALREQVKVRRSTGDSPTTTRRVRRENTSPEEEEQQQQEEEENHPAPNQTLSLASLGFHHVEESSDDENDEESFADVPPPPAMLRLWSTSAFHPTTSRIAGPIETQEMYDNDQEPCPPPPVPSFDDALLRQESWGLSGAMFMPDLQYETSLTFTALNLIDD